MGRVYCCRGEGGKGLILQRRGKEGGREGGRKRGNMEGRIGEEGGGMREEGTKVGKGFYCCRGLKFDCFFSTKVIVLF